MYQTESAHDAVKQINTLIEAEMPFQVGYCFAEGEYVVCSPSDMKGFNLVYGMPILRSKQEADGRMGVKRYEVIINCKEGHPRKLSKRILQAVTYTWINNRKV